MYYYCCCCFAPPPLAHALDGSSPISSSNFNFSAVRPDCPDRPPMAPDVHKIEPTESRLQCGEVPSLIWLLSVKRRSHTYRMTHVDYVPTKYNLPKRVKVWGFHVVFRQKVLLLGRKSGEYSGNSCRLSCRPGYDHSKRDSCTPATTNGCRMSFGQERRRESGQCLPASGTGDLVHRTNATNRLSL